MAKTTELVIDASPTVALVAALGDLRVSQIYQRVWVPLEVCNEIMAGGVTQLAVPEFAAAHWLQKIETPLVLSPLLANSLDAGEAAVIQLALDKNVSTDCVDEHAGRRMARLHGIAVTGSIGVLLRAKAAGSAFSMRTAIQKMQASGLWPSERVVQVALAQAEEQCQRPFSSSLYPPRSRCPAAMKPSRAAAGFACRLSTAHLSQHKPYGIQLSIRKKINLSG